MFCMVIPLEMLVNVNAHISNYWFNSDRFAIQSVSRRNWSLFRYALTLCGYSNKIKLNYIMKSQQNVTNYKVSEQLE